jgi:hypothetical protein
MGIAAQAVVQSLAVPGEIRDGRALLHIGLAITRPDESTFRTEVAKYLPPAAAQLVQVGSVIKVRYSPANEHEVVLVLPSSAWTQAL